MDEFVGVLKSAAEGLVVPTDSRNYGAATGGGREGGKSFTVFEREWATFATAVDRLLPDIQSIENVHFYRTIHGILCRPETFRELVGFFLVDVASPLLTLTQLHLGLRLTPLPGRALFLAKEPVLRMHRAATVAPKSTLFYHPGFLTLAHGHYR